MVKKTARILIVEENTDDYLVLKVMLSGLRGNPFKFERVSTYEQGMERILKGDYDVCLLGYRLNGKGGSDFMWEASQKGSSTPFVLLGGPGDEGAEEEAAKQGAADFLWKNKLEPPLLERSILHAAENKKSNELLRRREEFFRAVLENALDGVAIFETDGNIHYSSPSVKRILGYEPGDKINTSVFDLIHPEDIYRIKKLFEKLVKNPGLVLADEFQARHKDGSWKVVEASGKSHLFQNPDFHGIVVNYRDVTERKNAERTNLRLASIVESSNDAIYTVGFDGAILSWNPGAMRIYGFEAHEIGGRHINLIIPPKDRVEFNDLLEKARNGHPVSHIVTTHKNKNDQPIIISLSLSPIKDAQGQVVRASVIARDISEREKSKAVKTMLQDERDQLLERLQLQMANMPIACVLMDQNFLFTYWNPAAEKMFGYSFKEVEGKSPGFLFADSEADEINKNMKKIKDGFEVPKKTVRENRGKKRSILVCEWYNTKLLDAEGRFQGMMAMAVDITDRRKSEEIQNQFATILEQTPDAVISGDMEGMVVSWNRGAEKLFGYTADEIIGKSFKKLTPEDKLQEIAEMQEKGLLGESLTNFETVRVKKNGERVDVSVALFATKDASGKKTGVSAIVRDISERKKAEDSLKKHEEKMRLVEKMNAIGRLAGGVAHDFNNLLSVIGGNSEFLLGSLERESPHRDEVEEIQKAVKRGAELTKQLLVFGQKQVVNPLPINLNDLTGEMSKMLKRLIDANVELKIIQHKEILPILADTGQIQQVILNLVLNARDAMPDGGHLILETKNIGMDALELEEKPTLPKGTYVRLNVTDTGHGMGPEIQKHIFEPFFTTKAGKGTGLGLASVYGIVTKWSGHIFVHSKPGMGTTFAIYFPAMVSVEGFAVKPKQISLIPQGTETILVVEDEDPVRKILVRTLGSYGYKILEAANGIEAVKKAWEVKEKIDLLLTDTVMPKMNGKELADELHKTRPKMKTLFVSGYPKEILSQHGILGANINLIQKPFELEQLGREIRKILDEK